MLGYLPKTLEIGGKKYRIRTDYRNILTIFEAFTDDELSDAEKLFVCLKRIYTDFDSIPRNAYKEAYEQVRWFMRCGKQEEHKQQPQTFSWIKDEPLIFAAINKVAGKEVRETSYMHWWTFMGYFESIDTDGLFGTVLSIRQKRAKGKKLEKFEKEFFQNNRSLMSLTIEEAEKPMTAEERLMARFNELAAEDGD